MSATNVTLGGKMQLHSVSQALAQRQVSAENLEKFAKYSLRLAEAASEERADKAALMRLKA